MRRLGYQPWVPAAPQSYRDYFLAQQKAGRELAYYSCNAGKQADPIAYHRGQLWSAIKYNAQGSFYWDGWRIVLNCPARVVSFELGRPAPTGAISVHAAEPDP